MEGLLLDIVQDASADEVVDGRGRVVGGARVVIDLGVCVEDGDLDAEIAREEHSQEEAGGSGAYNYDLLKSALRFAPPGTQTRT